jgi:transposase
MTKGRPTANSPTLEVTKLKLNLNIERKISAIEEAVQLAGWRLYVTNAPITRLTLNQAIVYYRDQWIVERGFHRFKRGQLPALPIYFQNQDRIEGLMFLLTLALRVFTLIEFVVRQAISASKQKLAGLYDGNPKRTTERPSAEQLLKAFDNLTLYLLPDTSIFITKLSALHRQILSLLKLPESIYSLHLKPSKT